MIRTEYSLEYVQKLAEIASDPEVKVSVDCQTGTLCVALESRPDLSIYATPFWEDVQGIPVTVENDSCAGSGISFELPFCKTGDLERDAKEYVRLVKLIPEIARLRLEIEELKAKEEAKQQQQPEEKPNFSACPKCGSFELEGDSWESDESAAWQQVSCLVCNARWTDVHKASYRILEEE